MSRNGIVVAVAIALVLYMLYAASYVPPLVVGPPAPLLLVAFVLQALTAGIAAIGVWNRTAWAPAATIALGVVIAVTELVEGYGLGIISYNHALAVAVLALGVTIFVALFVLGSRRLVR